MTNNIFSINLNGYDWSNLYHVDYSGGSGGEYLTELIANKAGAKASSMIKDTPEGKNYEIMDSINNQYATPHIHDYAEPFLLKGQDPSFSQFDLNLMYNNPSLSGFEA